MSNLYGFVLWGKVILMPNSVQLLHANKNENATISFATYTVK